MPKLVLKDVSIKLQMRPEKTTVIHLSNDRPNIYLVVDEMQSSAVSKNDLARALRLNGDCPLPKFLLFANKRLETEEAVREYWKHLPEELKDKIVWFHSGMSPEFREKAIEDLKRGEIWGLFCTDAAGMVIIFTAIIALNLTVFRVWIFQTLNLLSSGGIFHLYAHCFKGSDVQDEEKAHKQQESTLLNPNTLMDTKIRSSANVNGVESRKTHQRRGRDWILRVIQVMAWVRQCWLKDHWQRTSRLAKAVEIYIKIQ